MDYLTGNKLEKNKSYLLKNKTPGGTPMDLGKFIEKRIVIFKRLK